MSDRRGFLRSFSLLGAAGAAGLLGRAAWQHAREIDPANLGIASPGRSEGHYLRDGAWLPPPAEERRTDVLIAGSGIAGLTAAWKMQREGKTDFLVVDGPQPYGNAAGARYGELACPTGAHYLPLPSRESFHVRELLADLGIIMRNAQSASPYYDERYLLHAPHERVLYQGSWQEGVMPREGVPDWELAQQTRFLSEMERLRSLRGSDGRRVFALPAALSSSDPAWLALDCITLAEWLAQRGYRAPTLLWFLDYACRDDYGRPAREISAWAGLHYFCSRDGAAQNAEPGSWLTWPGGLAPLAQAIDRASGSRRKPGTVVRLAPHGKGVRALCFELVDGKPRSWIVTARRAICAMPLFVAARVVPALASYGFDPAQHMPVHAPWLVANFLMRRFPAELPSAPLSWDNVIYQGEGLGYVVSTHQDIRVTPPSKTVLSAYHALSDRTPPAARAWMERATPEELL
ncbi:MAG: NAD(P)-binding protein, partial [Janthinobacterium lividum]